MRYNPFSPYTGRAYRLTAVLVACAATGACHLDGGCVTYRECITGYQCGNSCISRDKDCHKQTTICGGDAGATSPEDWYPEWDEEVQEPDAALEEPYEEPYEEPAPRCPAVPAESACAPRPCDATYYATETMRASPDSRSTWEVGAYPPEQCTAPGVAVVPALTGYCSSIDNLRDRNGCLRSPVAQCQYDLGEAASAICGTTCRAQDVNACSTGNTGLAAACKTFPTGVSVCSPSGLGTTGARCRNAGDCEGSRICTDMPGGYCATVGCSRGECPSGEVCALVGKLNLFMCLRECEGPGACDPGLGYDCLPVEGRRACVLEELMVPAEVVDSGPSPVEDCASSLECTQRGFCGAQPGQPTCVLTEDGCRASRDCAWQGLCALPPPDRPQTGNDGCWATIQGCRESAACRRSGLCGLLIREDGVATGWCGATLEGCAASAVCSESGCCEPHWDTCACPE